MKRPVKIIILTVLFVAIIGFSPTFFVGSNHASACGWGNSGGENYVPQRRGPTGPLAQRYTLTKEQAFEIVSQHVKRLNPDLEVGRINDAGSFFEAEILSRDNEVVQLVGVDKTSGRLILIN